jgi:hypothetical protein
VGIGPPAGGAPPVGALIAGQGGMMDALGRLGQ